MAIGRLESSSRMNGQAIAVACLALALSIAALVLGLATVPPYGQIITWCGMVLLMAGLFPLSAIAFGWLEVPGIIEQVKRDCDLLNTEVRPDPYSGRWSQSSYAVHYSLAIIATLMGVGLFFGRDDDKLLDINALKAMRFGFLGAYVYCLSLIYRRYTTLDLQPHVYLYCAAGLMAGMAFNYVAFEAIAKVASSNAAAAPSTTTNEFMGIGAAAAAILAFSLGYFPNLAIGWFGRLSQTALHQGQRRSDALPLALIDGISELHETRLRDEGIDNIQNLASANIRDLVVKTPFTAQEIVEWIDQAVLYLYLDPSEIGTFRRAGARCVTDFADLWERLYVRYEVQPDGTIKRLPVGLDSGDFDKLRKAIAQQVGTTEERLDALYRATEHGPNMHFVRTYWNNVEEMETRARAALIRKVCGRVGCAVRTSERDGAAVPEADVLKQVVMALLSEAATGVDDKVPLDVTAAALYGQAWLNRLLKNYPEARRLYEQCIERFPEDPAAFNDVAWLVVHTLQEQSLYDQALKHAKTAVDLVGKSAPPRHALPGYLDTLALAHIRLKQPEEARKLIEDAITAWQELKRGNQPKFLETLVSAAEVFQSQGKEPEARVVLRRVLEAGYADETTAKRAKRLLGETDGS